MEKDIDVVWHTNGNRYIVRYPAYMKPGVRADAIHQFVNAQINSNARSMKFSLTVGSFDIGSGYIVVEAIERSEVAVFSGASVLRG